jgi:hypothetical protein
MIFEVVKVTGLKIAVFWVVAPLVWWVLADGSEELTAFVIRAMLRQ